MNHIPQPIATVLCILVILAVAYIILFIAAWALFNLLQVICMFTRPKYKGPRAY